jgi:hypothetical protein
VTDAGSGIKEQEEKKKEKKKTKKEEKYNASNG